MIITDIEKVRIYLRPGRTDMRKAINGLSQMVEQEMGRASMNGDLFLFSNGKRLLKILYWDRNGFCLWQKRLEEDRFPWPGESSEVRELSQQELRWLLAGIDFFRAHRDLKYSSVS